MALFFSFATISPFSGASAFRPGGEKVGRQANTFFLYFHQRIIDTSRHVNTNHRYRIKDAKSGKHLLKMAYAVNTVWNYCQEVSLLALRREKRWLSAYDLHALVAGTSKDLHLSADTIQQVCTEYVTRRRQCKARCLKWRSRTRSLGWIPFKARYIRLDGDTVTYCGYRFQLWLSRPIDGWRDCVGAGRPRPSRKTGSFSQDARGRCYVNLQCAVPDRTEPLGEAEIGIDLGCARRSRAPMAASTAGTT